MTMNGRHKTILTLLNSKGRISVAKLAKLTSVSEVTIRNDLTLLEKQSYLKQVHGSAVTLESGNLDDRLLLNLPLKQKLALHAMSLINPGDTIFIEGDSTNALLARAISQQPNITVITVSVYIATLLKNAQCDIILLGGLIQKKSESMIGPLTKLCIDNIHFNKAFIGMDGFHPETGFTGRDIMRTEIINMILSKQAEHIIISDSSKFGQIHLYSLEPINAIQRLITDEHLPAEHEQYLRSKHIIIDKISTQQSEAD